MTPRALVRAFSLALLSAGLVVLALAGAAYAHTRSESHAVWELNGRDIDVVLTAPDTEFRKLATKDAAPSAAFIEGYLATRIFPTARGLRCPLAPPVEALSAAPGYRKFDLTFRCGSAEEIAITSQAFFDRIPSHIVFAQIQDTATGEFSEELLSNDRETVQVSGGDGEKLKRASFLDFILMGVTHIFTGVDHMSFLLGLVLISRRVRDLVFVVTGFTIGHSLTLALAVTGVIRPHAEYIDALVALTIALIGAENGAVQSGRPGMVAVAFFLFLATLAGLKTLGLGGLPSLLLVGAALFAVCYLQLTARLTDAGRVRIGITIVFGLVHGFGFAADLLQMQIPPLRLAELLVGFNLGVEIAQLTLVLTTVGIVWAIRRTGRAPRRALVVDLASAFLVGLGLYWFLGRSFA